jgi:hypothetical protein
MWASFRQVGSEQGWISIIHYLHVPLDIVDLEYSLVM